MHDVLILLGKGVAGGGLVGFALLSEGLSSKRFAGLFGAAPAVALAGLTIVLLDKGSHDAHESPVGMLAGYRGHDRLRRVCRPAAAAALGAWILVALIEEQEDSAEGREDARGAVLVGSALASFAAVAALTLGKRSGSIALLLATVAWFAGALVGYRLAWLR